MNLFLNACGMRRPLQIEVENRISHRIEIRSLDQPFAVIGRDPNCDVVLQDKQVSRRHVYIQVIAGRLFWVDLDSQLGTFVEGQPWKSGWLGNERVISIGPNDVRHLGETNDPVSDSLSSVFPQGSPLIWRTHGSEPLAEVTVEFLNGPSASKTWPIRRVLSLIGTAHRCKFRLADRSIEPFHCSLIRTSRGLFVVDLLGGDGVKVNNQFTRSSLLNDQDMLEVGRYQIRIHYRSPNPGADAQSTVQNELGLLPNRTQVNLPVPLFPALDPAGRPQAELLPFGTGVNYPASANQNDLTESVLVPLVSQFGMMQQQMFDQFQQTMSMMVQMFGKMHESQMELIRQEFDRLNELTAEINGLKAELAEMTRKEAVTQPQAQPIATAPSVPTTKPQPIPPPNGVGTTAVPKEMPTEEPPPKIAGATSSSPRQPAQASPGDVTPGDRDAIVWLHQRITSIQTEREGRWQKILKLLPGAS